MLGNVLRIEPEPPSAANPEVILSEAHWVGTIEQIESDEADYRFTPLEQRSE